MKVQLDIGNRNVLVFETPEDFIALVSKARMYSIDYSGNITGPSKNALNMVLIDDAATDIVDPKIDV